MVTLTNPAKLSVSDLTGQLFNGEFSGDIILYSSDEFEVILTATPAVWADTTQQIDISVVFTNKSDKSLTSVEIDNELPAAAVGTPGMTADTSTITATTSSATATVAATTATASHIIVELQNGTIEQNETITLAYKANYAQAL